MRPTQALIALALCTLSASAEPVAEPDELPRIPATTPEAAAATFQVKPGFTLDLVAHEPLVEDPIAMEFDPDGRLFVVEMRGYSERRDDARGRIRLLTDSDGDGIFDHASVYADGLRWPTSVTCFDGGVFVIASPDIWYFRDADGDGIAEERRVVFTGFGEGAARLNVQALPNGLQWGPDNRIWGATSGNGGRVGGVRMNGSDFSFDPRKLDLRLENGTAQNGMSFDSRGRRFVCSNSDHLMAVMWERAWLGEMSGGRLPPPLSSIATDGGAAPVFRISPDEPWRIVRTRWRVAGIVGGPVEGGGRVSGYFTGASGVTLYTGDAFGAAYADNAFVGDVGSNLVHRKIITPELKALRPADEQDIEFLASRDNWFRPANFANAPDGCLYVADMYREIIEHPWSLPSGIKRHLDLNSGAERGRIYRLRPDSCVPRQPPRLSSASADELAALLAHPNGWHRRTAQRLLWERGDPRAGLGWAPLPRPEFQQALAGKRPAGDDPWLRAAFLQSIADIRAAQRLFVQLSDNAPAEEAMLADLARHIGRSGDKAAIATVSESRILTVLAALAETAGTLDLPAPFADELLAIATDSEADEDVRLTAIRLASAARKEAAGPILVAGWQRLTPRLRAFFIDLSPEQIFDAVERQAIPADDLTSDQIRRLRTADKERAEALFPLPHRLPRETVIAKFAPSLQLRGDAARGKMTFQQLCIGCHRAGDAGFAVGPDAATFRTAGAESILTNIIDPNREIAPQYQAYLVTVDGGDTVTGVIARESPTAITLRQPFGLEKTLERKDVRSMRSAGASLMPEGLEAALTPLQMADLLAFLINP